MRASHLSAQGVVRRKAAAVLLAVTLVGTMMSAATAASATGTTGGSTPTASLTEVRVPGTSALSAASVDLAAYGYTEREFYAAGKANRYRGANAASQQTATLIDGGWAYNTRVLVRAPKRAHFNGTLLVEWTNVTIGLDADFVFAEAHESLLRQGYAIAVVSAQSVGVDRLKSWSPQRYGNVSVSASNVDPIGGGNIDACGASACAGDPLSWDVFTQVSAALKANAGATAPLPGLKVRNVIATGQSQSASRLGAYYNTIQPLTNFFDGFVLWDRATAALRPDLRVPAISVNSEGLSNAYPAFPTSTFTRAWEVAGSTHGSLSAAGYVDDMFTRDDGLIGPAGRPISFTEWITPSCIVVPPFSIVPAGLVVSAAITSVKKWVEIGKAAPPSVLFPRDAAGAIVRDAQGKVQGGIRLAQFVAPTSEISAFNGTAFPCSVSGSHRDYTKAELKQRYGSTGRYVLKVAAATAAAAKGGYILPFDAAATVVDAAQVRIG